MIPHARKFRPAALRRALPETDAAVLDDVSRGAKVLWVSSTGGHLAELMRIEQELRPGPDSLWVTFDTPQSQVLLAGRRRRFVDYISPRDIGGTLRGAGTLYRILQQERFDYCISAGAAIAVSGLPLAALRGIRTYYVESVARSQGPSLTGRMLALAPRVRTLSQYEGWSSGRWPYAGTVLDSFAVTDRLPAQAPRKILVTLGTIRPYRFDRAVDAVLSVLAAGDQVTWQLGSTSRTGLPGTTVTETSPDELADLARASDVVVSHAGVGSLLQLLGLGHVPVLAVRSKRHGEHVDDHQEQIARAMIRRGLGCGLDLEHPSRQSLAAAASRTVLNRSNHHEPLSQRNPL